MHHREVVYVDKIYVDEVYQEWTNYTTNVLPFISPTFSMHFNLIKLDLKKSQIRTENQNRTLQQTI